MRYPRGLLLASSCPQTSITYGTSCFPQLMSLSDLLPALSPMQAAVQCPADVLFQIFLRAVLAGDKRPSLRQAPLNVSQTCQSWRHAALSFPLLWTYLNMTLELPDTLDEFQARMEHFRRLTADERAAKFHTLEGIMQTWLDRSGTAPLSFVLKEREPMDDLSLLLLQHQSRW